MSRAQNDGLSLARGLGLVASLGIVVNGVVGTGLFLKAPSVLCSAGSPARALAAWLLAGLLSLAGALTYAELAAMMPRAGGEYVFVREAYGAGASFLYGWMQIFIAKTGSQASVAVALAIFLNDLTGGALNQTFFTANLLGFQLPFGTLQVVALSAIAILTLVNCAAVVVSGWIATALTCVKVALILGVGVGAFLLADGNWGNYAMANAGGG